ncbi:MAG: hypothetical protein WCX81_03720 [Monoglobales bacterium]
MDNFDFEKEFQPDEEMDAELDEMIKFIGEKLEEKNSKDAVINPDRMQLVLQVYRAVKCLTKGTGAKVTYILNEPYIDSGCVEVIGKDLTFSKSQLFLDTIRLASNFNVYAKTDGTVSMDLTFNGLTLPFEI